jgi:hypothetical protein
MTILHDLNPNPSRGRPPKAAPRPVDHETFVPAHLRPRLDALFAPAPMPKPAPRVRR